MKKRRQISISLFALTMLSLLISCTDRGGNSQNIELTTDDEKTLYAMGAMFGERLQRLGLNDLEAEIVSLGLKDSTLANELKVDYKTYQAKIQPLLKKRQTEMRERIKPEGSNLMKSFLEKGGQKTSSGLAYKIIERGEGTPPNPEDEVEVHYKGTLPDGTVVLTTHNRKTRAVVPLKKMINGWSEGIQLISPGGRIELVIPPELAYGNEGAPPNIPGGATLFFEIELFSVKRAGR